MIDPVLNRRLENCRQLMKAWHKFHSALTACIKGATFDEKAEAEFLKLKCQIAVLHDSFIESLENPDREMAATSQTVISIVERCVLLKRMAAMNSVELKRMEMEWHEAYLLINDTIGILEDKVSHLEHVTHARHTMEVMLKKMRRGSAGMTSSWQFQIGVVVLIVVIALIGLPLMGVFSYSFLGQIDATRGSYMTARKFLRGSVMKSMLYESLGEYEAQGRSQITYGNWDDLPGEIKEQVRNPLLFFDGAAPQVAGMGIETLDLRNDIGKGSSQDYAYKTEDGKQAIVFVYIFSNTSDPQQIEAKRSAWAQKLPDAGAGAVVKQAAGAVKTGTKLNVLFFVWSQDEQLRNDLANKFAGM